MSEKNKNDWLQEGVAAHEYTPDQQTPLGFAKDVAASVAASRTLPLVGPVYAPAEEIPEQLVKSTVEFALNRIEIPPQKPGFKLLSWARWTLSSFHALVRRGGLSG